MSLPVIISREMTKKSRERNTGRLLSQRKTKEKPNERASRLFWILKSSAHSCADARPCGNLGCVPSGTKMRSAAEMFDVCETDNIMRS